MSEIKTQPIKQTQNSVDQVVGPKVIKTKSGSNKQQKEISKSKGLYNFKFSKDHGVREEGETVQMHKSTALALEAHGIGKMGTKIKVVKKQKE